MFDTPSMDSDRAGLVSGLRSRSLAQVEPSEGRPRPRRGDDLSDRLVQMMSGSAAMTQPPAEPSAPPKRLSDDEVIAAAARHAGAANNLRASETQSRLNHERRQEAQAEASKPKRKSSDEIEGELRSWLKELTPGQRAAFAAGDQIDRLSPRMQEVALNILDEFEQDDPEPVADWLTGLTDDDDDDEFGEDDEE